MIRHTAAALLFCVAVVAQNAPVPSDSDPANKKIFDNSRVRAFLTELPPGGATQMHRHERDYLTVFLSDEHFTRTSPGQPPAQENLHAGFARMGKAGATHAVHNDAKTPFRAATVEFADAQGESRPTKQKTSRY